MDTFSILKILWKIRKFSKRRGLIGAVIEVFKPQLEKYERRATRAVENLAYFEYESKSIGYDMENIRKKEKELSININNLKKSINNLKPKTT